MGSGGYVVYDDSACIVDMSRYFGRFNRYQSCGKCVPCRVAPRTCLHMIDRVALGNSAPEDIDVMQEVERPCESRCHLCGLGQTAPLPLVGGLRYFLDEFLAAHPRQALRGWPL